MIAQFPNDLVRAVCAAVWLHGYAGDRAATLGEQYMTATDLLFHCWIDPTARRKFTEDPHVSIHDTGNIRRRLE
jgi:hypothetical protein